MQEPPNDQLQSLVNLYSESQYQQAVTQASQLLKHFSCSATLYNIIGVENQNLGKLKEALEAYKKALSIKPNYMDTYNNMGTALKEQGKLDEAIEAFNKALSVKPNYAEAHNSTGNVLKQQGKLDEAIEAFNKALSIKPDHGRAKHMLSALTGNTNETAPREYVEGLFDEYAKKYEASLFVKLEYKIPKLIKDILSKSNHNEALGSILDLGCGTGLFGSEIKNYCSNLEGIDLSQRMLAIAAEKKKIYDKLTQGDILEYLSSNNMSFDYLVAADVFVYIGDLSKIFRLIKSKNKKPGKLVFSTEHSEQDGYHILKTGRYSHSKSYVESLCKKFDYTISHFSTSDLRKEEGHFLTGAIYVLSF